MSRFTALKIKALRPETPDTYTLVLEKPASGFSYLPGQYLTIRPTVNGQKVPRAYSLSSSPYLDADLEVTIKRLPDGVVSNYIWQHLKPGDSIEVFTPLGNFTVQPTPGRTWQYVLIAAGSGITPIMSMIRSILFAEPKSKILLLYGSRDQVHMIFRERLEELTQKYPERLEVFHTLSRPLSGWEGPIGRLSAESILAQLHNVRQRLLPIEAYICGPSDMMAMAIETLTAARVPREKIHTEYFTAPLPEVVQTEPELPEQEASAIVKLDGKTHRLRVKPGQRILHAAQEAGLDPPYACEEGVCCTCRAKLHRGQVHMLSREALSDWEVEKGYILTCQALPLTAEVELEYG